MMAPPDDYRVGYGRPPWETRWKKGQSGDARRWKPKPSESTVAIIDRLLLAPVKIVLNGEPRKVSALEAIVFQLLQKAMSGKGRAYRALLKYQEFASLNLEKRLELTFVDSEYTRAFASQDLDKNDARL
jgi:hypothetical protein